MTVIHSIPGGSKARRASKRILHKPVTDEDVSDLWDLAEKLQGQPVPGVRMTEEEFDTWCDEDVRAEWVDGEVILLSPANIPHVDLAGWLTSILRIIAESEDAGRVFDIEAQIRLAIVKQRRNPDVLFVAKSRENIIKQTYIDGAPDFLMEIVSPDSQARDWRDKFDAYEKSGVREYWVIDQQSKHVEAYALGRSGKYAVIRESDGKIQSKVIRKLYIRPQWLWQSPLPRISVILKELGVRP
jgi:Uma2 family endonuclease